ncbi:ferredoxin [Dietzia maris]
MKVKIDHEFCVGHARCFALEPEYIAEDERGRGVVREDAPEMSPETARRLVRVCPESAISIVRD